MGGMGLAQTVKNGCFECGEIAVVFGIQTLFLDKLPEPLNQIEVGRVGRQKTEFDV